jgi:adenylate cyclase
MGRAIALTKQAYDISVETSYEEGIILTSYQLARGYLAISQNSNATKYFYISLKEAEKHNDSTSMSQAYMGLGLVMYNMSNWSKAIKHFNLSLNYQKKQNSSELMQYLMGLSYFNLTNHSKALRYLKDANKIAIARNDSGRMLEIRLYKNHINAGKSSLLAYLDEYNELIDAFTKRDERVGICFALQGKAKLLLKLGRKEESSIVAQKALAIARKIDVIHPLRYALELLVKTEYQNNRFKASADFLLELEQLKDSLMRQDAASQIALLTADHEFDKKELKYNEEINQQKRQRIGLGILAGILIFTSLFIFLSLRSVAKERKRSDELLANILPEETAKELKQNGVAKAKAHNGVTIVFADIKNFTSIANGLDPEVLVKMLDTYFCKFDMVLTHYNLEKIKTIGDAYMFVGGLQSGGSYSAKTAILASQEMISISNNLKAEMEEKYGSSFEFRIGMHSGNVVSGVVGIVKYAFDIWGDAVNVAARMEENSITGHINISADTYKLVKDDFNVESRGSISIKNGGKRGMYFVLGKKS